MAHNFDRISRESLTQIIISKKNLTNASALISTTYDVSKIIAPLIGSAIFVSVITIISIIAKLGQIEFKKTFPMAFIFFFLLGILAP